jgi:hypothetical protein
MNTLHKDIFNMSSATNNSEGFNPNLEDELRSMAKLDLPFDLNSLFTLTYSFDVLKQTIEFLAKNQRAHSSML